MNTKRTLLLVPLMILASCSRHADRNGAATSPGAGTPVQNGSYQVCNLEGYEEDGSPTVKSGFTLEVKDWIDIDSEKAKDKLDLVRTVKFERKSQTPESQALSETLHMVGCCGGKTLATTYRLDDALRLITIVDETAKYPPSSKLCPDEQTAESRLITVRFCYQEMDDDKNLTWECPPGTMNPHGGDVHAVSR
jgi:hypothetical protein